MPRIEQHPRQFPDQAGDRKMRVAAEIAGGTKGRRFARSVLVENRDPEAVSRSARAQEIPMIPAPTTMTR
jgi:hypothetical protein